jgi:septum formation protein
MRVLMAAGFRFRILEPRIEEPAGLSGHVGPAQQVEAIAYYQARRAAEAQGPARVLAVSTRVILGQRLLGPPFGRLEAAEMLRTISGTRHAVITGVAIIQPGRRLIGSETTYVTMRSIPELAIRQSLASGGWLGTAGAYASPEMAEQFVADREGSFSNLLGMPVGLVMQMLAGIQGHPAPGWAVPVATA